MGLKIKKSIKLGKFVKINANKTEPSVTVGGKKVKVTVNKKKVTASLPGTGISYDAKIDGKNKKEK